jgi:hypothetical protein
VDAVVLALRAALRSRWRSWLVIALLVSVVGGLALAATAAGRRTDAAFPQFAKTYGFDATAYATKPIPQLAKLPDVASATPLLDPSNDTPRCAACTHPLDPFNLSILSEPTTGKALFKLLSGRLPNPSAADQVLVSFTLQRDNGVQVGTVIRVPFFSRAQTNAVNSAIGPGPKPHGPLVALHVVGIVASPTDLPSGQTTPYEIYTTPGFTRAIIPRTDTGLEYAVQLRGGVAALPRFDVEVNALDSAGVEGVGNTDGETASIEGSIHPQAIGWFVLAGLAGLVGLAVIAQVLARQSNAESRDYPALRAIGADQRQLFMLGMGRNLIVGMVGVLGALVLAAALSPLAPLGEARLAESSTGISIDPVVFAVGALGMVIVVLLLGLWPALRAALPERSDDGAATSRPSAVVGALAAVGAPPSALIGVRHALQRRASGSVVPVGTAYLGIALAVVALCGTAVFGTSLSHLTTTPSLYGDPYELTFAVIPGLPDPALLKSLEHDSRIDVITTTVAAQVSIDGSTVGALAVAPLRGPLELSTVHGHLPDADGEIGLGAATMRQIGAHVGSVIKVTFSTPSGGKRTEPFRVVSEGPLPVVGGYVGLGNGAVLTTSGYQAAACPSGTRHETACRAAVVDDSFGAIVTNFVPGTRGQAGFTHYLRSYPEYVQLPVVPTSLINFGEAVNFPLIFGAIVAIFGAATISHLLVVSVARRRRETGLLKMLGFTNRQVIATVAWQATTLTLAGLVIGVPLGIIAGKATWNLFASQLGVVPVAVVSAWLIVALAAGVLVVANVLAMGPALAATRTKSGRLLAEHPASR